MFLTEKQVFFSLMRTTFCLQVRRTAQQWDLNNIWGNFGKVWLPGSEKL